MPHMTIMRGGPGSGKSWFVRNLVPLSISPIPPTVCSADDFFINDEGEYSFDPKWLGRAHGACLKKCVEAIMRREDVIIDNTNSKQEEMLPYLALCQAFDYSCAVVRVLCDPEVAWGRQKHGLPRDKFDDIHTTVRQQQVPKLYRGAPWLIIKDEDELPPPRERARVFMPYSGARCIDCSGTVVYLDSVRRQEHEHDSCWCSEPEVGEPFAGMPRPPTIPGEPTAVTVCRACDGQVALWNGILMPMHQQTTCRCEDPLPEKPRPKCNCGVSKGLRSDHESQCVAAYLRRNR